METQYNMRSPAVKRLMKEAQELRIPTEEYFAQPLEDNLFEWHFTVRGPSESDFDGGIYHGRIVLPPEYPMKPPSIILLTPNGRFEINKKICLSISGHHPESWQPSWSIRTALLAIIGFMPTHGNGAIGSLDFTTEERQALANKSKSWNCSSCGPVENLLLERSQGPQSAATNLEAKELAAQICFKGEPEKLIISAAAQAMYQNNHSALDKTSSNLGNGNNFNSNLQSSKSTLMPQPHELTGTEFSEIRQRHLVPIQPSQLPEDQQTVANSTNNSGTMSTVLIWVLSIAIAVLLVRRLIFL